MNKTHVMMTLALCLILAGVTGCGGGGSVLNPQFQPEVTNVADNFQFQATGVTNVTQTLQYTWSNTGVQANVDQATTVTSGTATLTIRDANGVRVYMANLNVNGSQIPTSTGASGSWTIQIVLNGMSGTINFRVQKKP